MDGYRCTNRRYNTPLISEFADYLGLPLWFVGGAIGLVATSIVLAILIGKFKGHGVVITTSVLGMAIINWTIFAWPLWAAVVVGIGFLWGMMR